MNAGYWVRVFSTAVLAPVNVKLDPQGHAVPPGNWIQLPGNVGTAVTFVDGDGNSVTLTSTSKVNTWPCTVDSVTSSTAAVTVGYGTCPPMAILGADGAAGPNYAVPAAITADPGPAVIDTLYPGITGTGSACRFRPLPRTPSPRFRRVETPCPEASPRFRGPMGSSSWLPTIRRRCGGAGAERPPQDKAPVSRSAMARGWGLCPL